MGPRSMVSRNGSRSSYLLTPLLKEDPGVGLEQSNSCVVDLAGSSIYNLNGTLCRKKHDDGMLWDIPQLGEQGCDEKPTLFQQTMPDDLLFRPASVGVDGECQPLMGNAVPDHWFSFPSASNHQQHMGMIGSNMPVFGNGIVNGGYTENQQIGFPGASINSMRPTSSDSQTATETNKPDEKIDKNTEKRQKRMIKNRESAARSRAKKQAYINKLHEEVEELKAKNEQLKKEKEEEMIFSIAIPKRHQLRRTTSSPF